MHEYMFKIRGMERLMTYQELKMAGNHVFPRFVKIIDVKRKRTWVTDYRTVMQKFG